MRLIGLMPVRNEDWCLGLTARAALMWCDALVILAHACNDDSHEIIEEISGEVFDIWERNPAWTEMEHRQRMLDCARGQGATHIAIIDADELLTANLLDTAPTVHGGGTKESYVRNMAGVTRPGHILQLPGYNLRGSLDRYHANGIWGNRWFSTAFPDDPKLHWAGDTFHQREPLGLGHLKTYRPVQQGQGGVLHLWGASERRLEAKHALYKLTERLRWPNKPVAEIDRLYSLYAQPQNGAHRWEYSITPQDWLAPYAHLRQYLHVDAVPWQEAECARLLAEHPGIRDGLDLFGVVG